MENLASRRASLEGEVHDQWNSLNNTYGGLTTKGRQLRDDLSDALFKLDSDGLQRALGLKGIEDLPESEASKQLRQVVTDLIKPEEGVDYWMQDSEWVDEILGSESFIEAAADMGYTGQGLDVLQRVTQQYDGELGVQERADDINEAYRIFELGQPPGGALNWLKAATTVLFNREAYDAHKGEQGGISPEQAARDTEAEVPQIEAAVKKELPQVKSIREVGEALAESIGGQLSMGSQPIKGPPDLKTMRDDAAAKATPESAEPQLPEGQYDASSVGGGDVPSEGTVQAMQRVADSQGQPLPIGQSGFFVQPGQEGKLFQPAEGREGELVEYVPPAPERAAKQAFPPSAAPGSRLQEPTVLSGEPDETFGLAKTGTDGWADYELSPDGTLRFTQKGSGREVTVSKNQPGAYYAILEDVFEQEIPARMKPIVAAAKARLATPPAKDGVDPLAGEDLSANDPQGAEGDVEQERKRLREAAKARAIAAKKVEPAGADPGVVEEEESSLDLSGLPGGENAAFEAGQDIYAEQKKGLVDPLPVEEDLGAPPMDPNESGDAPEVEPPPVEASSNLTKLINSALSESLTGDEEEPGESAQESETTKRIREGGGVNQQLDKQRAKRDAPPEPPPEQETSEPSREETSEPPKEEPLPQSEPAEENRTMAEQEPYTNRPQQSLQPPDAPKEAPHTPPGQSTQVGPTSFESLNLPAAPSITTSAKVAAVPGMSQAADSPKKEKQAAKQAKRISAVLESAKEKGLPNPPPGGPAPGGP